MKSEASFKEIKPGDLFPALPVVVHGLSTEGSTSVPTHHGFYLTHREFGSDTYLWGLYVPEQTGLDPGNTYSICHETNVENKKIKAHLGAGATITIEDSQDYELYVLGQISDCSDPNADLPNLTYEGTLKLAEQIREALK